MGDENSQQKINYKRLQTFLHPLSLQHRVKLTLRNTETRTHYQLVINLRRCTLITLIHRISIKLPNNRIIRTPVHQRGSFYIFKSHCYCQVVAKPIKFPLDSRNYHHWSSRCSPRNLPAIIILHEDHLTASTSLAKENFPSEYGIIANRPASN